jgi:hypothetical protein
MNLSAREQSRDENNVGDAYYQKSGQASQDLISLRPEAAMQQHLAEMIAGSPRTTAQVQRRAVIDQDRRSGRSGFRGMPMPGPANMSHTSPGTRSEHLELSPIENIASAAGDHVQLSALVGDEPGYRALVSSPHKTDTHALPDRLRVAVESLSGFAMGNVRVHYNSAKPAQLRAHAYAQGSDIFLATGQEKYLPHEAWHIVQQAQGRVSPTAQLEAGIALNDDDGLEREADLMGARALSRSQENLAYALGPAMHLNGPMMLTQHYAQTQTIQRQGSEIEEEGKRRNANKLTHSSNFEKRLGIAAYQDNRSLSAARSMLEGIRNALLPEFDELDVEKQKKFANIFGRDDSSAKGSAGQVGKVFETLWIALDKGNLRERMTGIYNAALKGFKETVVDLIKEEEWQTIEARGLDVEKLRRRRLQLRFNPAAKDLYRQPRNVLDRKTMMTYDFDLALSETREQNLPTDQWSKRKVSDLTGDGTGLSERESRFMFENQWKIYDDRYLPAKMWYGKPTLENEDLKWKEGGTSYSMKQDHTWVKKIQDVFHMPVLAGPSGTALRFFQAWEYLHKPAVKEDFRLALLGWMLTSNDHSFHEIMMTCAEFDMPYEPGLLAYRSVEPFSEAKMREIAGAEGFPDEAVYMDDHMAGLNADGKVIAGNQNSILATPAQVSRFQEVINLNNNIWAAGTAPSGGQLAQVFAILVYTDEAKLNANGASHSAYEFINNVLKENDNWLAMRYFISKDANLTQAYKSNKFNVKQLVGEANEHARMIKDGLKLLKPYKGMVYRGYRTFSKPSKGTKQRDGKIFSMSADEGVAKQFLTKGSGIYSILVEMPSVTGRPIGELSMFPGEQEVLFAPGTEFIVDSDPVKAEDHYVVKWRES